MPADRPADALSEDVILACILAAIASGELLHEEEDLRQLLAVLPWLIEKGAGCCDDAR